MFQAKVRLKLYWSNDFPEADGLADELALLHVLLGDAGGVDLVARVRLLAEPVPDDEKRGRGDDERGDRGRNERQPLIIDLGPDSLPQLVFRAHSPLRLVGEVQFYVLKEKGYGLGIL